ncbi:MAG: SCP2 sterol-binding domain-containing protein [Actinomycetota bacterium]|nr:SCP2 sterol-binding domain-containing protein [Actinomycetota bacterium]
MNEGKQSNGLESVTPEQFAELVGSAENDDQIKEVIHSVGTDETLKRIFEGFEERFMADKATGVEADVVFHIDDDGTEHSYTVSIKDGACSTTPEATANPKTTLKTDLPSFVKLVAGKEDGVKLFMAGKLRVSGDLMFAQRFITLFDRPTSA